MKAIRAVVTDANGDSSTATTDVYVILNNPNRLYRGKTYRINGHLFTVPDNHDLRSTGVHEVNCVANDPHCDNELGFAIIGGSIKARLLLKEDSLIESRRWQILEDGTIVDTYGQPTSSVSGQNSALPTSHDRDPINLAFDSFLKSRGQLPVMSGPGQ